MARPVTISPHCHTSHLRCKFATLKALLAVFLEPPSPTRIQLELRDCLKMQMPSATKCFQTVANPFLRQRGRAPGALSHMVSANLRARALAPIVREIWAAGHMSYNAVSRELNRRQVPTLRGGKKWYPMTAGRLLVRLERTGLIRIRRQSACSLLELASRESRSTQRRCDRSSNVIEEVWLAGAVA
jgi:hypothetical protein